jgi:aryl-alcohol dehydrogenase-like predicted oxidoreductase
MKLSIGIIATFLVGHSSSFVLPETATSSRPNNLIPLRQSSAAENIERDFVNLSRRDAISSTLKTAAIITGSASVATSNPLAVNAEESAPALALAPAVPKVPTVTLGKSSLSVSRTIQGYWQLAGGHGKYNQEEAITNMKAHYDAGITTLDTADIYGPSEFIVGKFMKQKPENAVVCTKFCCFKFLDEIDRAEVKTRIQKACERLQVEKIPLVQFFWSNYDIKKYVDVALMLTELKEEGLIGEIGATNFDLKRLQEMKNAGVPLVSHQVQLSCLDQRPVQSGMVDWCAENDVSLIAFGTVGSGILSEKYLGRGPPTQEEKNTASMRMYSKTAERFGNWKLVQELLQTMDTIAGEVRSSGRCVDANIANVAQRYVLETKSVASVLIGVRNRNHIAENIRTHTFVLTGAERDVISAILAKRKGPPGDVWDLERGYV